MNRELAKLSSVLTHFILNAGQKEILWKERKMQEESKINKLGTSNRPVVPVLIKGDTGKVKLSL
jgi:hypothetical protein